MIINTIITINNLRIIKFKLKTKLIKSKLIIILPDIK